MAEASLQNPFERVHGVSVTASPPDRDGYRQLERDMVEQHSRVHDTPMPDDPLHRTAELPKPITKDIVDQWNRLWGFQ
jgi:hypothetical protein